MVETRGSHELNASQSSLNGKLTAQWEPLSTGTASGSINLTHLVYVIPFCTSHAHIPTPNYDETLHCVYTSKAYNGKSDDNSSYISPFQELVCVSVSYL